MPIYMLSQLVTNALHKIHRNTKTQLFGDGKMKNKFGKCRNTFHLLHNTIYSGKKNYAASLLHSKDYVCLDICGFLKPVIVSLTTELFLIFLLIVTVNFYQHLNCKFQGISVMLFTRKNLMRTSMVQSVSASFANIQVVLLMTKSS